MAHYSNLRQKYPNLLFVRLASQTHIHCTVTLHCTTYYYTVFYKQERKKHVVAYSRHSCHLANTNDQHT